MTSRNWRDYRAYRRHVTHPSQHDCFHDSCLMYAMNVDYGLGVEGYDTIRQLNDNNRRRVIQDLSEWPGVTFNKPHTQSRKLALFFSDVDFHFARLDDGVWSEKYRTQPPRVMEVDARGRPVSGDKSYKFDRYLYVTPTETDPDEYPWQMDMSRYTRNGVPKLYTRRGLPCR